MSLPPSARGARSCDPEPSELHEPGPRVKTCSSSCLSWLHPLRSWSLRQTRGGSKWFRLSAEQGDASAQNKLGYSSDQGQRVPQDYNEAAKWFRLSAEKGNVEAQHNLGLMYVQGKGVNQDYARAYMWFDGAAARGDADEA